MPRSSFLGSAASIAVTFAGALLAAGIALWQVSEPAPPARAAVTHAMTANGAQESGATKAVAAANRVTIDNFSFGPATLTVAAGTTVVWTNDDSDSHIVRSEADPKLLNSPPLDTGDTFTFTFDKPGSYRYFCSIHPRMRGTIVVQ